jgi:hypothetical protein
LCIQFSILHAVKIKFTGRIFDKWGRIHLD